MFLLQILNNQQFWIDFFNANLDQQLPQPVAKILSRKQRVRISLGDTLDMIDKRPFGRNLLDTFTFYAV